MTPVRNGVQYLDKYFENVEKFADALVFLDDGSTDNTYDIIKEHHVLRQLNHFPSVSCGLRPRCARPRPRTGQMGNLS